MATGFKVGTKDLDDIFDPYVQGAKPAATGYTVGGVDLNQRYAPLEYGSQAAATGMKIAGGADLNTLWAAKGTAVYLSNVTSSGVGNPAFASIDVRVMNDGRIVFTANNGGTLNYHSPVTAGVGSQYRFRIFGNVSGMRFGIGGASMTGKGGVSFTAAPPPGNSASYDTGWQTADDAANILTMQANTSLSGTGSTAAVDGVMNIQVRRQSDMVIVREFSITFGCYAESTV